MLVASFLLKNEEREGFFKVGINGFHADVTGEAPFSEVWGSVGVLALAFHVQRRLFSLPLRLPSEPSGPDTTEAHMWGLGSLWVTQGFLRLGDL